MVRVLEKALVEPLLVPLLWVLVRGAWGAVGVSSSAFAAGPEGCGSGA